MRPRLVAPRAFRLAALPLSVLALTACADDGVSSAGPRSASMSFSAGAATGGAVGTTSGAVVVGAGSDTLVVTRARLVFDEVELERGLSGECVDDGDDTIEVTASCAELEVGPFLVDLPLAGGVTAGIPVQIPEGTYHELELKLEEADDDARAFRQAHPEMNGISVLVEGTHNGRPFTWRAAVEAELEMHFEPNVVVGADGTAITVEVEVSRWFRTGAGAIIDPATAGPGTANGLTVAANIRSSFLAFRDDDRDGHRDGRDGGDDDDRSGSDDRR